MDVQALHRGGQESPTGKEAVPRHGRGARGDQRRAGSRTTVGGGAHQGTTKGPGDGGPSSPDRLPA